MTQKYDTIIIGAGIAGLLTALRLALNGQAVLVVEKDKIGSGSTSSNHGMVHSGALYARQHGQIVRYCQEAQDAFSTLLPEAEIPAEDSLYFSSKNDVDNFITHLKKYDFSCQPVSVIDAPEVNPEAMKDCVAVLIKERVFSSAKILEGLAAACNSVGITFLLGTKVNQICLVSGKITGVTIGAGQTIHCKSLVLANGLGLTSLLKTVNSKYCQHLKSRLDMMVHLPHANLKRGLIFADLDKPILMPAKGNSSLGSFFGGIQPQIQGDRKFPVDFSKSQLLIDMIGKYFDPSVVNTQDAVFYMCGKTDYTDSSFTEKGFINPGFHIIDHTERDQIAGLYSVITGKMTLGFHASKKVADNILNTDNQLIVKPVRKIKLNPEMLAVEPWSALDQG